jgi:hypothetical protein
MRRVEAASYLRINLSDMSISPRGVLRYLCFNVYSTCTEFLADVMLTIAMTMAMARGVRDHAQWG